MVIKTLIHEFQKLQSVHGDAGLDSIHGGGCIKRPDLCLVFMNPTAKNVASLRSWEGLKTPWIGTKNIWKLLHAADLIDITTFSEIQSIKPNGWTENFANKVYKKVSDNNVYITNLAKCTQVDARPLKNDVFKDYLDLMHKEIKLLKPKKIVTFGNQVSSIILGKNISVSKVRRVSFPLKVNNTIYKVYPLYYPVGQGMRNIDLAIEDLKWVRKV